MGYQNQDRPKRGVVRKLIDASFDMSDLVWDLERMGKAEGVDQEYVLWAARFVQQSVEGALHSARRAQKQADRAKRRAAK